jgi:hypothetical protein
VSPAAQPASDGRGSRRGLAARAALAPFAPGALGALWALALCGRLLSPAVALANRDVPGFHLPLRTCLVRLASQGWPSWKPGSRWASRCSTAIRSAS